MSELHHGLKLSLPAPAASLLVFPQKKSLIHLIPFWHLLPGWPELTHSVFASKNKSQNDAMKLAHQRAHGCHIQEVRGLGSHHLKGWVQGTQYLWSYLGHHDLLQHPQFGRDTEVSTTAAMGRNNIHKTMLARKKITETTRSVPLPHSVHAGHLRLHGNLVTYGQCSISFKVH